MDRARLALDLVESAPVVALDVETTGLNPRDDRICGWVVATDFVSLYFRCGTPAAATCSMIPVRSRTGCDMRSPNVLAWGC